MLKNEKMMKKIFNKKWLVTLMMGAAMLGACTDNALVEAPEVDNVAEQNELCYVTVDLNAGVDSRLALSQDGKVIKSVWSQNDGFTVVKDGESKVHTFSITDETVGSSEGVFKSNTTPTEGSGYYVYYPASIKSGDDFNKQISLRGQEQVGDGTMDHLAEKITMCHYVAHYSDIRFINQEYKTRVDKGNGNYSEYTTPAGNLRKSTIWKLVGTNLPVDFQPVSMELEVSNSNWVTFMETNGTYTNDCMKASMTLKNFDEDKDFEIYMVQSYSAVTLPKGSSLRLTVRNEEGECYYSDKTFTEEAIIPGGTVVTFQYNGGWTRGSNPNYRSEDFSKDKETQSLQTHTYGQGIKVVFMGDGFSDRQITDGTYDEVMNKGMEAFFSVQPFTYYRNYFDVDMVYAVSTQEGCKDEATESVPNNTAFSTWFGEGTYVAGNFDKCVSYAKEVSDVSDENIQNTLIIVMMNSTKYAGTCHMRRINYPAESPYKKDYGVGVSVSYFPIGTTDEDLTKVLNHEANGHGFAKLDDEYYYNEWYDPGDYLSKLYAEHAEDNSYGWFLNVSTTSDPEKVYWANFIGDATYSSEQIGVIEGAHALLKYWWRPTQNSIMNDNTGGFNAPSRKIIYYRINKLANGDEWEYNHDDFKALDVNWIPTSTMSARSVGNIGEEFVPLARPVVTIVDEFGNVIRTRR